MNMGRAQTYHRGPNQNIPAIPIGGVNNEEMNFMQDYGDAYGKLSNRGKSGSGNHRETGGSSYRAQGHHKANSMQIMGYPKKKEEQKKEPFGQKNSHIVMNQQHVKMKQGKVIEPGSPIQEKIAGQKVIFHHVPLASMQPGAQPVSHKKANSLMNQKMMQLLLNKDSSNGATIDKNYNGTQNNLKSNPNGGGTFHAQTPNIINDQYNQIKSKSFMNEIIGGSSEVNRSVPSSVIKQSKKAKNSIASSPSMSTVAVPRGSTTNNNVLQGPDAIKPKAKKIAPSTIQQSQLKNKMISNSFDKTSGGPQIKVTQKLGMKQQSFQNKATKKPTSSNVKHPSAGMPTSLQSGFVTGMVTAGMVTHGQVSGHQSIMTSSTNNLHQGVNHQRTRSDANHMPSNTSGKNFVISSSNHVYPTSNTGQKVTSKKATNLQAMSNNNQVGSQGATKGLLKYSKQMVGQRGQQSSATRPMQQQPGHKKNQYSTIVKSNYKNLVSDTTSIPGMEFGNEYSENGDSKQTPLVDLEIFNSSQNKTTEQKYAELKLKYNDLLSKHFALAAQKTEDNRDKFKGSLDGQYYPNWQPVQQYVQSDNVSNFNGQPHTTLQTLDPPQIIMNQSNGSQGIMRRGISMGSKGSSQGHNPNQYYENGENMMISFVEPEQQLIQPSVLNLYSGAHSNERSQKQTPRTTPLNAKHEAVVSEGHSLKGSVSTFQNNVYRINLNNSRTEAAQPMVTKTNKHSCDDANTGGQKRFVIAGRVPMQYGVQKPNAKNHKRSVSDGGIFNNLGLKNKVIRAAGGLNMATNQNEFSYNQQKIPMKDKSMQNSQKSSFENKINDIRQTNGLPRFQQNMVILEEGDDEHIATMLSQNSNNEENIHTEIGQEHSLEFPQQDTQYLFKKQNAKVTNLNNEREEVINSGRAVVESMRIKKKKTKSLIPGQEESDMNKQIKKYKQKRKNGEHGQTHTGQIMTHNAPNGETYIEMNNEPRGVSHRRVKSGASDQVQPKLAPSKVILFKNVKGQTQVNQRSLKYLKEQNPATKATNQFMMIQEDDPEEVLQESLSQEAPDNAFGPCQFSNNNNKKVINVSFNDFNQSMSNEYEDVSKDNIQYSRQNSNEAGFGGLVKQTNQTSNKNLNNFLEALSKIKPQNPVVSNTPKIVKGNHKKMKSEMSISNELQHELKISSMSGNTNQMRLEKYQKMMQKVKENDKNIQQAQPYTKIQVVKNRETINSYDLKGKPQTMSPTLKATAREEPAISQGMPECSGDELKITFVGDQALLNKFKKKPVKWNPIIQTFSNDKAQNFKPKNSGMSTSGQGSNTGGQPSPIISTKRVPQKIIAQIGDESAILEIQQNNFILEDREGDISPLTDNSTQIKKKGQPSQGVRRKNNKSQGEIIPNNQEMDDQFLIQNLNKLDRMKFEEENHIHIIKHPVPSGYKHQNPNSSPLAPQVSERLITEDSNCTGLTPRSKNIRKLIKLIKLGFRQNPPIPPATTIDFYRIGKILGKGAFGKVNLAIHKLTQCVCAIKSINKQFFSDESQTKKVMQEVVMLKKTRHQNIVRLYEYFETEKHILFVIELCAGGDLLNYVRRRRRLKEDVAKCLFKQIIESLAYCHSKSILHRDIKLDNILLDANGQVKLCDFGVGKIVKKGEKMTEQCGTPAYIAPEILRDKGYYGFKVDIWSAGVVLYAMLYGTVPFKSGNMTGLQEIITKAKYSLKDDISLEARDLLKGLLEKDPQKRLNISQILNHEWLKDAVEASEIELFTEQERQYIKSEFSYGKSSRYGRNKDALDNPDPIGMSSSPNTLQEPIQSDLEKDMFTEHMLDSTQNSILKNCETKSVILAPFNSTKSNLQDENEYQPPQELSDSIKELMESRRIIKYGPRVRDIDKQYEINNNADLDNGVYHKFDEEEEQPQEEVQEENLETEVNEELNEDQIDYDDEEREILQQLKNQGKKKTGKNKQSELQRLENMIQDQEEKEKENTPNGLESQPSDHLLLNSLQDSNDSPEKNKIMMIIEGNHPTEESQMSSRSLGLLYQTQLHSEILIIDESIVQIVNELGYPRDYLQKCLNTAELNYASTSYWLLYFTKRVQEIGEKWEKQRHEQQMASEKNSGGLILTFKEVPE